MKIISEYVLVPLSDNIALEGAKIRAETGMRLPDALISATAQLSGCDCLVTTDIPVIKKARYKVMDPTSFSRDNL